MENGKLTTKLQNNKITTVNKDYVSQLMEKIRNLESENAKLKIHAEAPIPTSIKYSDVS